MLFNKILAQNERCIFYFYLKKQRNFLVTLTLSENAGRDIMPLLFHNCLDIKFIMSPEILHRVAMRQGTYPGLRKYLIGRRQGILTPEH